jgi:hypothetical protein
VIKWLLLQYLRKLGRSALAFGMLLLALFVGALVLSLLGLLDRAVEFSGLGIVAFLGVCLFAVAVAFFVWWRAAPEAQGSPTVQKKQKDQRKRRPVHSPYRSVPAKGEYEPPPAERLNPFVPEDAVEIKNRISQFLIEHRYEEVERLLGVLESTKDEELCQWSALQRRYVALNRR